VDLPTLLHELNASVRGPSTGLPVVSLDDLACMKGGPQ
jgi:hypothetical protein